MSTQNNPATDKAAVSVIINGKQHGDWSRYQIDSDFLIPADAWSVSLGLPEGKFPADVVRGAPVMVKVGDDTVLTGRIDGVQRAVARGGVTLSLSGRDSAAVLVDCAAPILTTRQMELLDVVAQIVRPLGITKILIESEGTIRSDKISAEPG